MTFSPVQKVAHAAWRHGDASSGARAIPEETAVAFTFNRHTYAVMMATPADLEDFAIGFSLSERVISMPNEIESIEALPGADGIEVRMWITKPRLDAFTARRRYLAGPTGCGLCGVESLAEAMRPPPEIASDFRISADAIVKAVGAVPSWQHINQQTSAVHAAAYWAPNKGIVALREDVGRHNALDKLGGALARAGTKATSGVLLLTSRVSVEMIQKAAVLGVPVVAAISAPTALAVRFADQAGITLAAIVRDDSFEVFTHQHRITGGSAEHVA